MDYKNILLSTFFLSFMLLFSCQKPAETQSELKQKLDAFIEAENQKNVFSGSVTIGSKDSLLYQKHIGLASRVWDVPIDAETRFDMASVNKSFVAGLVMIAQEEGKLSVADKLADYFPNAKKSFHPEITLHQMLSHLSGLPDYDAVNDSLSANGFKAFKRMHFETENYIDFISQLPIRGEPGKKFYYSNFAYHLLSIILEKVYEKPFSKVLEQKICRPLRLKHTYAESSNEVVHKKLAEGYNYQENIDAWTRNNFIDLTLGRRIFTSSGDLYKWGKALCSTKLLSQSSLDVMMTNHVGSINPDISYGYGLVIFDGGKYRMGDLGIDREYIIHGGATEGYKAMLVVIEHGEHILSMLANTGSQLNEIAFSQKLIRTLIGTEKQEK